MGVRTKIIVTAAIVLVAVALLYSLSSRSGRRLKVVRYKSTPVVTQEKAPEKPKNVKTEPDKEPVKQEEPQKQQSAQTSTPPEPEPPVRPPEPEPPQVEEPQQNAEEAWIMLPDGRRVPVKIPVPLKIRKPKGLEDFMVNPGNRRWRPMPRRRPKRPKWPPLPPLPR